MLATILMLSVFILARAHASTTTIVATVGPASSGVEVLEEMINSGMDFARINFSHGSHESNSQLIYAVREASKKVNKTVPIIVDLQGPKIQDRKIQNRSCYTGKW